MNACFSGMQYPIHSLKSSPNLLQKSIKQMVMTRFRSTHGKNTWHETRKDVKTKNVDKLNVSN